MFRQRPDQPRALAFAAGVHLRGLLLALGQQGVVAEALRARLVGHRHVVNRLLDFGRVLLVLRVQQVEALAQERPEGISAQLFQLGFEHGTSWAADTTNSMMEMEPPGFSHLSR